jgi:ribose transport system permease protein
MEGTHRASLEVPSVRFDPSPHAGILPSRHHTQAKPEDVLMRTVSLDTTPQEAHNITDLPRRSAALFLLDNAIVVALLVAVIVFSLASPEVFFSSTNLISILRFASLGGIIVACYSCAMIAGQLDLSTSQVGAFTGVVFALLFQVLRWPLPLALLAALAFAGTIGWLNGQLINRVGLPSLVTTLAVGTLIYGLSYLIVDGFGTASVMRLTRPPLRSLVNADLFGIPVSIYLMFALYAVIYVLLNHTRFGAHLYAIGGNPQAARLNGIRVPQLISTVLVMTAIAAGVATILLAGRQLAVTPTTTVLASPLVAALFAGVSLSGGVGRIERTLIGVLFFSVLGIGLSILSLPPFVRFTVEGLAFVLALLTDSIRTHLEQR